MISSNLWNFKPSPHLHPQGCSAPWCLGSSKKHKDHCTITVLWNWGISIWLPIRFLRKSISDFISFLLRSTFCLSTNLINIMQVLPLTFNCFSTEGQPFRCIFQNVLRPIWVWWNFILFFRPLFLLIEIVNQILLSIRFPQPKESNIISHLDPYHWC